MDLLDLEHNTRDGVHIAALAGSWIAAVHGFGGMRDHGERLTFRPRIPSALTRLGFTISWHGGRLSVSVDAETATYRWADTGTTTISHYEREIKLTAGEELTLPIPPIPLGPEPVQPRHRAPARRHRTHGR